MSKFALTDKYDPALTRYTMGTGPLIISQVLGFGIAGAVLANALVFIYFASAVASG
jgi:hypothetical protein